MRSSSPLFSKKEKHMSNMSQMETLTAMLTDDCGKCPLGTERLRVLLRVYGTARSAAYHACLELASSTQLRSEGTTLPEQREYWLTRAAQMRRSRTGTIRRADNA